MKKNIGNRIVFSAIALFCLFGLIESVPAANAAVNASYYLSSYYVGAFASTNSRVIIDFDVDATNTMDLVGSSYTVVQVYENGVWKGVSSYFGSTSNGMLASNTWTHTGSITYIGTPGKQYRALVTVYACDAYGSDSRTVATNSVTAQ